MKGITAHWSTLLPILSALIGGVVGFFGAILTLQTQIESLEDEIAALGSVAKDLESTKQISLTALSKVNDAIAGSASAHDLASNAAIGVDAANGVAKHALEMVIKVESATSEAVSRADTAAARSAAASNVSKAAHEIAKSALNEARLSNASAAEAVRAAQKASNTWPIGNYCILKRGNYCPSGFEEGHLHFDTEDDKSDNRWWGLLPAGSYYKNNLDLIFCCK